MLLIPVSVWGSRFQKCSELFTEEEWWREKAWWFGIQLFNIQIGLFLIWRWWDLISIATLWQICLQFTATLKAEQTFSRQPVDSNCSLPGSRFQESPEVLLSWGPVHYWHKHKQYRQILRALWIFMGCTEGRLVFFNTYLLLLTLLYILLLCNIRKPTTTYLKHIYVRCRRLPVYAPDTQQPPSDGQHSIAWPQWS